LCAKPSDYLFVSYAGGALDGKTLYPAPLIDKLRKMYPNAGARFLPDNFIKTKRAALREVGGILTDAAQNAEMPDMDLAMLEFYRNDTAYKAVVDKMQALTRGEKTDVRLTDKTVERLYGDEIITSVSRLESYIGCPFSYFVRYNLKAAERRVYRVDYVDLGNIFHAVLEEFSKILAQKGISWKELDGGIISGFVKDAVDVVMKNDTREILGASGANRYLARRVLRIAEKSVWALSEHIKMGDFEPYGMEVAFVCEAVTGITLDFGGKKFVLTGRIDRIDISDFEGKQYVKIIDYKTGTKKFSYTDVYYGMQLQLLLYLDYFLKTSKAAPEVLPGGIFYFNINDPVINAGELKNGADFSSDEAIRELNGRILDKFKMSGLMAADLDVARAMDNTIETAAGKRSRVIGGVQLSDTETGFTAGSPVAAFDDFALLREYANAKILEVGGDILRGKIDKRPYKSANVTGCDYCGYSGICKFSLIYEGKKYRVFKSFRNVGEVVGEIGKGG
jgi:ATP-dependent helicase/nuclease subunit B